MRIGIYDPYLDTLSGGEKYMLSIASCLSQEHDVFVFWNSDKEIDIKKTALRKLGIDLSSIRFYPNIFDKKISLLSRIIQSRKFDLIIYLSDGSFPIVGTKLYLHFQFPIELTDQKSFKNKLKLSLLSGVICNSYFTKYFIDRKLGINSKVLYPPVTINSNNKIKKENIILHVGRFHVDQNGSNYKKQDVMIKAFKQMIDRGLTDWELVMVIGVRDEERVAFNEIEKMSDGYPIRIIENPSNEKLWENYSKAKIYWHATGFGENLEKYPEKAEHFGISTVEAMGSGAVPVVINVGGQKEIVEDDKSGFLWNTLKDLEILTKKLIEDEKLWKKMSSSATNRSRIFSENKFCSDLKSIVK